MEVVVEAPMMMLFVVVVTFLLSLLIVAFLTFTGSRETKWCVLDLLLP